MTKIELFALAQKAHEGWFDGSISWRCNNPGNIIMSELARKHGAKEFYKHPRTGHEFAIFPTYEDGWAALIELITNACTGKSKIYSPDWTILQYCTKYSPIRNKQGIVVSNYTYANDVAKRVGVSINTKLKDLYFSNQPEDTGGTAIIKPMTYTPYSQTDIRWRFKFLGNSWSTIGSYGCYITALGNMIGRRPDEVNEILKKAGAFNKDLVIADKAAKALNLDYLGKETNIDKPPSWSPSIKEVKMGKYQHFVLRVVENGVKSIIDSWDGKRKRIDYYPFSSYRLFRKKLP